MFIECSRVIAMLMERSSAIINLHKHRRGRDKDKDRHRIAHYRRKINPTNRLTSMEKELESTDCNTNIHSYHQNPLIDVAQSSRYLRSMLY